MMTCTLPRICRVCFNILLMPGVGSATIVSTAVQAQTLDAPDNLPPGELSLALTAPGANEPEDDSSLGKSKTETFPASQFTLESGSGSAQGGPEDLQDVNRKLSNPVSDVWALFTEFDLFFSGGDADKGHDQVGSRMIFQPIMPVPLYGHAKEEWKLITRPTLPILFSQPVSKGLDEYTDLGGLGDLQLPTLIGPPTGKLIFALGPDWLFPTATRTELGRQQWGVGPSGIFGYSTKQFTAVLLPQYYFGIGGWGDKPDANYMNLLYAFIYHLPGGWDIGTNPSISYDRTASPGDRWNVPVGLFVGKMVKVGKMPVKLQLGFEYSVVRPDSFGQQAQIKFNIIPVIPSLLSSPLFGDK